jgi:hypothetical protein
VTYWLSVLARRAWHKISIQRAIKRAPPPYEPAPPAPRRPAPALKPSPAPASHTIVRARARAPDPIDQLARLADLHDRGALTDDEFAAEKAKILRS